MNQVENGHITVPSTLLDNVVQFVEVSSWTAKRAIDEVEVHRMGQKKAADLRRPLLEHMLKCGVIDPKQKEAADAMLGGHDTTLQLLKASVDKIAEMKEQMKLMTKRAGDNLGQAVDGADVGFAAGGTYQRNGGDYNSLTSPMVGEKTSALKESDKVLLSLIGK